jgi:hypothetical protein
MKKLIAVIAFALMCGAAKRYASGEGRLVE